MLKTVGEICMNKRESERLEKLSEKIEQMKAQKQDILAREKARQRKERTSRLIQIGALSEKYFDVKDIQPADYEVFLKMLLEIDGVKGNTAHFKN